MDNTHWLYKNEWDSEIETLYKEKKWGAYRIYNYLVKKYGKQVLGIATINVRVRQLKQQQQTA